MDAWLEMRGNWVLQSLKTSLRIAECSAQSSPSSFSMAIKKVVVPTHSNLPKCPVVAVEVTLVVAVEVCEVVAVLDPVDEALDVTELVAVVDTVDVPEFVAVVDADDVWVVV
jgi:hypothetical protein